ncbi:hypothetical protein [Streptomyces sp. NPDC094468]|uniref:hypothetical protein n=1 Tax=Streptomyces sp. NPDC094468 TaxID=3366066 RepID=UPI003804759C
MAWWQACLWGVLGAGLIEATEMWQLYRSQGHSPWLKGEKPQYRPYLIAVFLRFFMAGGLNAAYAASNQVAGPVAALTLGIAAPLIIQHITDPGSPPPPAADTGTGTGTGAESVPVPEPSSAPGEQASLQPPAPADRRRSRDGR